MKRVAAASLATAVIVGSAGLLMPAAAAAAAAAADISSPQAVTCVTVGPIYWGAWQLVPPVTACVPTP